MIRENKNPLSKFIMELFIIQNGIPHFPSPLLHEFSLSVPAFLLPSVLPLCDSHLQLPKLQPG